MPDPDSRHQLLDRPTFSRAKAPLAPRPKSSQPPLAIFFARLSASPHFSRTLRSPPRRGRVVLGTSQFNSIRHTARANIPLPFGDASRALSGAHQLSVPAAILCRHRRTRAAGTPRPGHARFAGSAPYHAQRLRDRCVGSIRHALRPRAARTRPPYARLRTSTRARQRPVCRTTVRPSPRFKVLPPSE